MSFGVSMNGKFPPKGGRGLTRWASIDLHLHTHTHIHLYLYFSTYHSLFYLSILSIHVFKSKKHTRCIFCKFCMYVMYLYSVYVYIYIYYI